MVRVTMLSGEVDDGQNLLSSEVDGGQNLSSSDVDGGRCPLPS